MIYLDNAATTLYKPEEVIKAVADAMRHMGNPGRGAHDTSLNLSLIHILEMVLDVDDIVNEMTAIRDAYGKY